MSSYAKPGALSGLVISCFLVVAAVPPVLGQVTDDTSSQTTPTPGDGHNYLKMLGETVNPKRATTISAHATTPRPLAAGPHLIGLLFRRQSHTPTLRTRKP